MTSEKTEAFADVVAGLAVVSVLLIVAATVVGFSGASVAAVSAEWFGLFSFVSVMSATKLYGKGTLRAIKSAGSKLYSR